MKEHCSLWAASNVFHCLELKRPTPVGDHQGWVLFGFLASLWGENTLDPLIRALG